MTPETEQNQESWEEFQKTHVVATLKPAHPEPKTESKLEVFEALLSEHLGASVAYNAHKRITDWRDRYDSADRYKPPLSRRRNDS